jgi:hypothetical protein
VNGGFHCEKADKRKGSNSVHEKIGSTALSECRKNLNRSRKRANKLCQIWEIRRVEKLGNLGGYDRVLPGRVTHDYCAVDTPQVLSYCRGATVDCKVRGRRQFAPIFGALFNARGVFL